MGYSKQLFFEHQQSQELGLDDRGPGPGLLLELQKHGTKTKITKKASSPGEIHTGGVESKKDQAFRRGL